MTSNLLGNFCYDIKFNFFKYIIISEISFNDKVSLSWWISQIKTVWKRVKAQEGKTLMTLHEYHGDFTPSDDGGASINVVHNEALPSYLMFYCGKSKYNLSEDLESFSFEKNVELKENKKTGHTVTKLVGAGLAGNQASKGSWGNAAVIGMATSMINDTPEDKEVISFNLMLQFKDGVLFFGKTDQLNISKFFDAYSATNFEKFSGDMVNIIVTNATQLSVLRSNFRLHETAGKQSVGIKMEELKASTQLAIESATRIRLMAIEWNSANLTDVENLRIDEISKELHDEMSLEERAKEYAKFTFNLSTSESYLKSINTSTIKDSLPLLKESLSKLPSGGIKCVPRNALNMLALIGSTLRDFFVKNKEGISQAVEDKKATLNGFQNDYLQGAEIRNEEDVRILESFNREIKANESSEYPLDQIIKDHYKGIAAATSSGIAST